MNNKRCPQDSKRHLIIKNNICKSRAQTENICSFNKYASRANSHCEVRQNRKNCLKNEPTSSGRSSSVPPRPPPRKNSTNLPLNYIIDHSFSKAQENSKRKNSNDACNSVNSTSKKNVENYSPSNSSSSLTSSPKHIKEKPETCFRKDIVKRPIPTPRSTISEHKPISLEDYEYLQFSLRITEDIIRNDLYSQKEMRRVFNSHIEANTGRLNMRKMLLQIDHLCKELNLSKKAMNKESKYTSTTSVFPTTDKCCELQNKKEQLMQKIYTGHMLNDEEICNLNEEDLEDILNTILNSCQCDYPNCQKEYVEKGNLKPEEIYNSKSDEMFQNISPTTLQPCTPEEQINIDTQNNIRINGSSEENNVSINNSESILHTPSLQQNTKLEEGNKKINDDLGNMKIIQNFDEKTQSDILVKSNIEELEKQIIDKCEGCGSELSQILKNMENIQKILGNCDTCSYENICKEQCDLLQGTDGISENIQETDSAKYIDSNSCKKISVTKIEQPITMESEFEIVDLNEKIMKISLINTEVSQTELETSRQQIVLKKEEIDQKQNITGEPKQEGRSMSKESIYEVEHRNSIETTLENQRLKDQVKDNSMEHMSALIKQLKEQEILQKKQTSQHRISTTRLENKNKQIFQETESNEKYLQITEKKFKYPEQMKEKTVENKINIIDNDITQYGSKSIEISKNTDKDNVQYSSSKSSPSEQLREINLEQLKFNPKENSTDLYFSEINSLKSINVEEVNMPLERHSEYDNGNDISRNELISSITKFILDRTFSKINSAESAKLRESKHDFVSTIQKVVNDQTNNLYECYIPIPEKKLSSNSNADIVENICIESLDKYQVQDTGYQKKIETKRRKSSTSSLQSLNADLSKSSSSLSKKIAQKSTKTPNKVQSNILQYLEKYEQNNELPNTVFKPCFCDYEMIKPYSGKLYDNYVPKFSRSKFYPNVSTQTSNTDITNYRGFSNNLLSDGEIECSSTDISDNNSSR